MKLLSAILIFFASSSLHAKTWEEKVTCGNSEIVINITEQEEGIKVWEVSIKAKSKYRNYYNINLGYEQVYFNYQCQKTKIGSSYFVYQAYCSGSACRDKDNWGIIDGNANLILAPYKNNREWKNRILNDG